MWFACKNRGKNGHVDDLHSYALCSINPKKSENIKEIEAEYGKHWEKALKGPLKKDEKTTSWIAMVAGVADEKNFQPAP